MAPPWPSLSVVSPSCPRRPRPCPRSGSCTASFDVPTQTITLTADCDTFEKLTVPDGWTLDGAGHKIIAVQDVDHPSFTGAVLASAVGDDTDPATMNARDLTVTSRGFDAFTQDVQNTPVIGISMVRAGGTLTDVTVDGIAHNAPGQLSRAIFVDNQASGGNDVPSADVTLDRVTTTRFQKSGLFLRGNLGFDVKHATVGQSENVDGTRNLQNASNGIVAIDGAHGSITDSRVGENRYPGDDGGAYEDVVTATGILLQNATQVTLARNVIEGVDGDTGVTVANYTDDIDSNVTISCSTLVRQDGGHADDNLGFGVWNYEGNNAGSVELTVASNTFTGWRQNVSGDATQTTDPSCPNSTQLATSASQVAYGDSVTMAGKVNNAYGFAASGTVTLQRREVGSTAWTTAGTDTTTDGRYSFDVTPKSKGSYRTKFTAVGFADSISKLVTVGVAPRVGLRVSDYSVKRGSMVSFTGSVAPNRAGHKALLQRFQSGRWVSVQTDTVSSTSAFGFNWRAPHSTGKSSFRVLVNPTANLAQSVSRTAVIKVVR